MDASDTQQPEALVEMWKEYGLNEFTSSDPECLDYFIRRTQSFPNSTFTSSGRSSPQATGGGDSPRTTSDASENGDALNHLWHTIQPEMDVAPFPARQTSFLNKDDVLHTQESVKDLKTYVVRQTCHRIDEIADGAKDYVISNLKDFSVVIGVLNEKTGKPAQTPLKFTIMLVHERTGLPVAQEGEEEVLSGSTEASLTPKGHAFFLPKVAALSEKHGKQRFKLLIFPSDSAIAAANPALTLHSEPFRAVTKLRRNLGGATSSSSPSPSSPSSSSSSSFKAAVKAKILTQKKQMESMAAQNTALLAQIAALSNAPQPPPS